MEPKCAPEDLAVLVGAQGPLLRHDPHVRYIVVGEIFIHPDWTELNATKYDADIAILQLTEKVSFSFTIQPVCMPGYGDVVNFGSGLIVGWNLTKLSPLGRDINFKLTEENLKHSSIRIDDSPDCYSSFESVLSTERTLCCIVEAGSIISDYSGTGLVMPSHSSWVQFGLSITATSRQADGKTLIMLTNVQSFRVWIERIVEQSGGSIGVAKKTEIHLGCVYEPLYSFSSACLVHNIDVWHEEVTSTQYNASDPLQNVQLIKFVNGTMVFLVDSIGLVFPILESIHIGDAHSTSLGLKRIKRSNFQNMQNLTEIVIHKSEIESVDENTFWDLPNLERLHLEGKVKVLNDRIFNENSKLKEVYLASNWLEILPRNLFANNSLLNWVNFNGNALKIIEIDFTAWKHVKYVFMENNDCINAHYNATTEVETQSIPKLREFQILIMNNCSDSINDVN